MKQILCDGGTSLPSNEANINADEGVNFNAARGKVAEEEVIKICVLRLAVLLLFEYNTSEWWVHL